MMITVLGPDGSGKTTLAKKLADNHESLTYEYFGNNIENRKYKYFKRFLYAQKKGKANTLLKYIFILINDFYCYKISRKKNIITDRGPIDKLLGSIINKSKLRIIYYKATLKLLPKPDFVILLVGNPKLIYLRKEEIPVETIEDYMIFYHDYVINNKIPYITIDTCLCNIDETYRIATKTVRELL